MTEIYRHHRIKIEPRQWKSVVDELVKNIPFILTPCAGRLYGIWRNQIGRPRDELTIITVWKDRQTNSEVLTSFLADIREVTDHDTIIMHPTHRPKNSLPPAKQGNYAFRWFETPVDNWLEFLDLCIQAWPGFEKSYDSQVIGLWKVSTKPSNSVRALLLTRRPNLAMWEQSKIPRNKTEQQIRDKLSRRYDLCDSTFVYTTTLLTAHDHTDETRWT